MPASSSSDTKTILDEFFEDQSEQSDVTADSDGIPWMFSAKARPATSNAVAALAAAAVLGKKPATAKAAPAGTIPKRPASAKASASVAKKTRLDPDQPICQDTVCLKGPFALKPYILHKDKEDGKMKLVVGVDASRIANHHAILQEVLTKIKANPGCTKRDAVEWRDALC